MNSFLVICCLIVAASAAPSKDVIVEYLSGGQKVCRESCRRALTTCPPINCPPVTRPPLDPNCGRVDCSLRVNQQFLWPSVDGTIYYQCVPTNSIGGWAPMERNCTCMTLFDFDLQRCVHPHEFRPVCNGANPNPTPKACPVWCPTCDDPITTTPTTTTSTTTPVPTTTTTTTTTPAPTTTTTTTTTPRPTTTTTTTTPAPTTTTTTTTTPVPTTTTTTTTTTTPRTTVSTQSQEITTTPGPNTCQCPCMPCIWWPCLPCPRNCPCT